MSGAILRKYISMTGLWGLLLLWFAAVLEAAKPGQAHPNVLIIIADDLGIGDLGCFGNDTIKTPNIDRLASEGLKLTHHLTTSSYCTPSRASLMTSRYPARYGLAGEKDSYPVIMHVASRAALPEDEITIGEVFSSLNYKTGYIGKWHLGSHCSINLFERRCLGPKAHGFDYFYGVPLTLLSSFEDIYPFWPQDLKDPLQKNILVAFVVIILGSIWRRRKRFCIRLLLEILLEVVLLIVALILLTHSRYHTEEEIKVSPWLRKFIDGVVLDDTGSVIHQRSPFPGLSQELVNQSVRFIEAASKKDKPFLLIHSFTHVHTPMFISKKNEGRSLHGKYGDNVEEMDEQVGVLMESLKANEIDGDTIVYFVSDNGGHLEVLDSTTDQRAGGHNHRFKGGKGQGGAEGGLRVPGILRWPNHIPENSLLDHPTSLMDMMPTLLHLADLPPVHSVVQDAKELDGEDVSGFILNPEKINMGSRILFHHCFDAIQALRLIRDELIYKMYLEVHVYPENSTQCHWGNGYCGCYLPDVVDVSHDPLLFELTNDPFEDDPIDSSTDEYQSVVSELKAHLHEWQRRVVYPPSLLRMDWNTFFIPWLQPF